MPLAELLDVLEYSQYPQYYLKTDGIYDVNTAPLCRFAQEAGIDGIYIFQSSSDSSQIAPNRGATVEPVVYVAEAQSLEHARSIHRALWNYGKAPFLIIKLPDHIRVYTGFDYSRVVEDTGILIDDVKLNKESMAAKLKDFTAESINSGNVWRKRAGALKLNGRVDRRLLKNLGDLGEHLREKLHLKPEIAHALIGKYIYIRYLRDHHLLTSLLKYEHHVRIEEVLSRHATVKGLRDLVKVLDEELNGSIFPLDFTNAAVTDEVVSLVASIFKGDQLLPGNLRQLSLDFEVYDFEYIPIEMLSSIYEQFLHIEGKGKQIGAFYTPTYLADYLLAEMNSVKPLTKDMKVLDPSCGSGIFLVLAYRQLIEMELVGSTQKNLPLAHLSALLQQIYGVERELDACYVTEFSLILTMLHYTDPRELQLGKRLLPSLHNRHIFQHDFFQEQAALWETKLQFDWIVGNPPWIKNADEEKNQPALKWIEEHEEEEPVSKGNIAEAFSWRVLDLLKEDGCAGLILPASSLYNFGSMKYRQKFFQMCEVVRMTNFSNLRYVLFEGRAIAAAVTLLYHKASMQHEKALITHYGPFAVNQTVTAHGDLWTIILNENEIQTISPDDAESGDPLVWKLALWGTERDKRAMKRLQRFLPGTLGQFCKEREEEGWHLHEGSQLRFCADGKCEGLEFVPHLVGKNLLDTIALNKTERLFSLSHSALRTLQKEECYVRIQGGKKGLLTSEPPHLIMSASWKYVMYSDDYFVIKPRQIGLSVPKKDTNYLRALAAFLSSSVARYYLFFRTPSWGIERDRITLEDVKSIPIPDFTLAQVEELAQIQQQLEQMENEWGTAYTQTFLDEQIARVLKIPSKIMLLAVEFNRIRTKLIGGGAYHVMANKDNLQAYAQELADELDGFISPSVTRHKVTISYTQELICCTVELVKADQALPVMVEGAAAETDLFGQIRHTLQEDFSQWVYIQRGLRVFEGRKMHLYKNPSLIHWTRTQALNDADDLIAEILTVGIEDGERRNARSTCEDWPSVKCWLGSTRCAIAALRGRIRA